MFTCEDEADHPDGEDGGAAGHHQSDHQESLPLLRPVELRALHDRILVVVVGGVGRGAGKGHIRA